MFVDISMFESLKHLKRSRPNNTSWVGLGPTQTETLSLEPTILLFYSIHEQPYNDLLTWTRLLLTVVTTL